jgi:transcriptional regulator with XRE-family HTH domain
VLAADGLTVRRGTLTRYHVRCLGGAVRNDATSRKIRAAMLDRGISQTTIGDRLGLVQTAVSHRLTGRTRWLLDDILTIADILDVPVTWLVDDQAPASVPAETGTTPR